MGRYKELLGEGQAVSGVVLCIYILAGKRVSLILASREKSCQNTIPSS